MKNSMNITLGNINLVIDGQPVQLENIQLSYENEASVQELATSASFIKDMVNEVKSMIKEAQASAQQYNCTNVPAPKSVTETTSTPDKVYAPKKIEQKWDLPAIWKVMTSTLPAGFDKAGIGSYVYTYESKNDKKTKTTIKIAFNDSIDMRIYVGETKASFYLYEDAERSWVDGINPTLIDELIDELPEGVKEFVRNFVKKVLNK